VSGSSATHQVRAWSGDIDIDEGAILATLLSVLPATQVRKRGVKGETLFYYGPKIEKSRSWSINGKRVFDLIGPGRQTVLPPSIHPDSGAPYMWTGTETLEEVAPEELPELTPDTIDRISAVLAPFGCTLDEPAGVREAKPPRGDDDDKPHRQLNDAALANLAAWVRALRLCRCRRTRRGGYEAVPIWRPSSTGRPTEKRHLNLKIDPAGIRDFGGDRGFTPLDLVMVVRGCDLESAWRFLSEHLGGAKKSLSRRRRGCGGRDRSGRAGRPAGALHPCARRSGRDRRLDRCDRAPAQSDAHSSRFLQHAYAYI
jgi:hypothetical protein